MTGLLLFATGLLLVLKLTGTAISWLLVFAPILAPVVITFAILGAWLIVGAMAAVLEALVMALYGRGRRR